MGWNQRFGLGQMKLEMLLDIQAESTVASGLHKPVAWWVHQGWNSKSADHQQMNDI